MELPNYVVYVVCLEAPAGHGNWQGRQWARLDPTPWGLISHNSSNQAWCERAANWIAQQIQKAEGGQWVGQIRDCSNDPKPQKRLMEAEKRGLDEHIIDGPDGPGRRHLVRKREKGKPSAPNIPIVAQTLPKVPPLFTKNKFDDLGKAGPTRFEPENDPELQPQTREPGQDG